MTQDIFNLHTGSAALLVSIPHLGTTLPAEIGGSFSAEAATVSDTDWHLDRLYDFARNLGASVLSAKVSRYAIDLNRPASGESLYPGQTTTGLCPRETFRGVPLYGPGQAPDDAEIARRCAAYWDPYHEALRSELERLRQAHGRVLLWDAHSIASVLPRLFEGKLPDLNIGTNSGASCAADVLDAALAPVLQQARFTHAVNGRFKGGYITRHYGRPELGVHAIQLEMCQCLYMSETPPFEYLPASAAQVQPLVESMLAGALARLRSRPQ